MNMKLNGEEFEIEKTADYSVVAYNNVKEILFEGLWEDLLSEARMKVRYPIEDGDYDWDEGMAKELADEWFEEEIRDWFARGAYTMKLLMKYSLLFVSEGSENGSVFGTYATGQVFEVGRYESLEAARGMAATLNKSRGSYIIVNCYEC